MAMTGQQQRPSARELAGIKAVITDLQKAGLTYREVAKRIGASRTSVSMLICKGRWVSGWQAPEIERRLSELLASVGGMRQESKAAAEGEDFANMLYEPLRTKTLNYFKLDADPFDPDDVGEEPWLDAEREHAIKVIVDTALKQRLSALIADSGAGKSVVMRTALRRIERKGNVDVIRLDPNLNETLTLWNVVDTILEHYDERTNFGQPARVRRAQAILSQRLSAGNLTMLVIEEAQMLRPLVLRGLKRIWEWTHESGRRLLGIMLVGQPGLGGRASGLTGMLETNLELREVAGRLAIVRLGPLDARLSDYLRWRIRKVKDGSDRLFNAEAVEAMQRRLNGSSHPMLVNILAAKCLNEAARRQVDKVDAEIVGKVR